MAEFYSARGWEIPPLPWTNLSPPFSNGGDKANIEPGMKALEAFVPYLHSWSSPTVRGQLFKAGNAWVTFGCGGCAVRLQSAGLPVGVTHLKVKGHVGVPSVGYMAAVKGANHPEAVDFFINELVGVEMQEGMYLKSVVIPTNQDVLAKHWKTVRKDVNGTPFNLMDPKKMANYYFIDYSKIDRAKWAKRLARIQALK